jgi:hypothetical protein
VASCGTWATRITSKMMEEERGPKIFKVAFSPDGRQSHANLPARFCRNGIKLGYRGYREGLRVERAAVTVCNARDMSREVRDARVGSLKSRIRGSSTEIPMRYPVLGTSVEAPRTSHWSCVDRDDGG